MPTGSATPTSLPYAKYGGSRPRFVMIDGTERYLDEMDGEETRRLDALLAEPPGEIVAARGFKRDYRSRPVADRHERVHCPYVNNLHDEVSDEDVAWRERLYHALSLVPEGEVVEIVIRRTGKVCAKADDPWVLQQAHTYGPNSNA